MSHVRKDPIYFNSSHRTDILRRSPTFTRKKVGLRNNEQIRVLGLAWLHEFI